MASVGALTLLLSENKVWSLSRQDLESELKNNPEFALGVLQKMAQEVRAQSKVNSGCRAVEIGALL